MINDAAGITVSNNYGVCGFISKVDRFVVSNGIFKWWFRSETKRRFSRLVALLLRLECM